MTWLPPVWCNDCKQWNCPGERIKRGEIAPPIIVNDPSEKDRAS